MERMKPCASCGTHVREGTCACPHCGSSACRSGVSKVGVLLGFALLAGCTKEDTDDTAVQAEYGVAIIDVDADGYDSGVDCDDDDPAVHPGADETVGDDVDSNCDGEDDT